MDAKPLRITFDKVNGVIKICNGIRYLELSNLYNEVYYGINSRIYNTAFDGINDFKGKKSGIGDSINHNFARIRIDSYNSLPTEKILTFHNVITPIKLVVNKNKNECNNNKFLGKVCIKINPIHDIIK